MDVAPETGAASDYLVRRSRRARRARLTITDGGVPVVVLPMRAPERLASELVDRHRAWIERHVSRIRSRRAALDERPPLGRGRGVMLQGLAHTAISITAIEPRTRSTVRADGQSLIVTRAAHEPKSDRELLERWLRSQARVVIAELVDRRSALMGIRFRSVTIRDQRTRWGSASRRGTLNFNWRLVMAPPEVLDYVVVHELAHLRVAGHGRSFWGLVDEHFPDSAIARRWLRDHHDELRHALD